MSLVTVLWARARSLDCADPGDTGSAFCYADFLVAASRLALAWAKSYSEMRVPIFSFSKGGRRSQAGPLFGTMSFGPSAG